LSADPVAAVSLLSGVGAEPPSYAGNWVTA
jgi:hypothetical protein